MADEQDNRIRACLVSATPEVAAQWHSICDWMESKKSQWIADLRSRGFKAAHPNDGWVDRERNQLRLIYPQFDDGVEVGDLVMLGWPSENPRTAYLRPVRITGKKVDGFMSPDYVYSFEDSP